MHIADAQVHIWAANSPDRPWPEGGESLAQMPEPFGAEALLDEMDAAGVARAVLVPPSWEGDYNDVVLAAAQAHPERFAAMGRIDVARATPEEFGMWMAKPGLRGFRVTFHRPPYRDHLLDGTADWFFDEAAARATPVMVLAPGLNAELGEIARRRPDLRLIIDHLNLGRDSDDGDVAAAVEALMPLAQLGNIAVKISALPTFTTSPYPFAALHPHIERVVGAFGAPRTMWGSDLTRLSCSYLEWVRAATEEMDFLTSSDKEWLMGRSLAEWLDWPLA